MRKIKDYTIMLECWKNNCSISNRGLNENRRPVIIKIFNRELIDSSDILREHFENEVKFLLKAECDSLLTVFDCPCSKNNYYLVSEGLGNNLFIKTMQRRVSISENEAVYYFVQIWRGYNYMIENKLGRRDMTLKNIQKKDEKIIIDDLGFRSVLRSIQRSNKINELYADEINAKEFISPEELEKGQYIPGKSEVWSLGNIFFYMLFGGFPWRANSEVALYFEKLIRFVQGYLKAIKGVPLKIPLEKQNISQEAQALLKQMLNPDPLKRISWGDLINHSLFAQRFKESAEIRQALIKTPENWKLNVYLQFCNPYQDMSKDSNIDPMKSSVDDLFRKSKIIDSVMCNIRNKENLVLNMKKTVSSEETKPKKSEIEQDFDKRMLIAPVIKESPAIKENPINKATTNPEPAPHDEYVSVIKFNNSAMEIESEPQNSENMKNLNLLLISTEIDDEVIRFGSYRESIASVREMHESVKDVKPIAKHEELKKCSEDQENCSEEQFTLLNKSSREALKSSKMPTVAEELRESTISLLQSSIACKEGEFENKNFVEIYIEKLQSNITKYNILGKTVGNAEICLKGLDTYELWRIPCFLIYKRLLIFRKRIIEVLENKENLLQLPYWDQFIETEEYEYLLEKTKSDNKTIFKDLERIFASAKKRLNKLNKEDTDYIQKFINLDLNQNFDLIIFSYLWLHSKHIDKVISSAEKDKNFKKVKSLLKHSAEITDSLIVIEMNFFEDIKDFFSMEDHLAEMMVDDINSLKQYLDRKKAILDMFKGKYIGKGIY